MGVLSDLYTIWGWVSMKHVDTVDGVALFICKDIAAWNPYHPDVVAYQFGDNIVFKSKEFFTGRILKHELRHVAQYREFGTELLFRPALTLSMVKALVLKGDPDLNSFEAEALSAEEE